MTNKQIFSDAWSRNRGLLNIRFLSRLHGVSPKTVESWLYELKNNPPDAALLDLHDVLKICRANIPASLSNWISKRNCHIKNMSDLAMVMNKKTVKNEKR